MVEGVPGESLFRSLASRGSDLLPEFGLANEFIEAIGEPRRIIGRNQKTVHTVFDNFAGAAPMGGDDGPRRSHGLGDDQAEGVGARGGRDDDVQAFVYGFDLVDVAAKKDVVIEVQAVGFVRQFVPELLVAGVNIAEDQGEVVGDAALVQLMKRIERRPIRCC